MMATATGASPGGGMKNTQRPFARIKTERIQPEIFMKGLMRESPGKFPEIREFKFFPVPVPKQRNSGFTSRFSHPQDEASAS